MILHCILCTKYKHIYVLFICLYLVAVFRLSTLCVVLTLYLFLYYKLFHLLMCFPAKNKSLPSSNMVMDRLFLKRYFFTNLDIRLFATAHVTIYFFLVKTEMDFFGTNAKKRCSGNDRFFTSLVDDIIFGAKRYRETALSQIFTRGRSYSY